MVVSTRLGGVLLRGSLLAVVLGAAGAGVSLTACGDDTVVALPDGAAAQDSTTSNDAVVVDVTADTYDAGCVPYDASDLDDAEITAGHLLVVTFKCQKCHGDQLAGNPDGVTSPETEGGLAYPPNLTPDPTTGLGCWTNAQIENAFLNGIDNEGDPLCPPMPHFAEAGVDASGADDILTFLRSLPPTVMHIPDTPSCTLGPVGPVDAGGEAAATDSGSDAAPDAGADAAPDAGDAGDAGDGGAATDAPGD